ncbi:MAG TPA: radical SAM protein, partial [Sulfurimonas sp.]|nr:radical SAM protein [Sulfurimonas sp.]
PFPARHLLPMENYIKAQEGHGPSTGRWTSILSSRGCPYGCTFCESRKTKWVARSPQDVVDEIEHCMNQWGITEFHFEDDNMTIDQRRLIAICNEIIQRGLQIKWQTPNGIRASRTSPKMLAKMKESGCMHITLAPESGSVRVLTEIIKKGNDFSLEQLKACGAEAHKLGLKVAAYFIIGFPGETKEDIELSIQYAKELTKVGIDEVAFGLFIPLPGTPLWDIVSDKLKNVDWLDLLTIGDLGRAVSWNDNIVDTELHRLRRRAYLSFHLTRMVYHPFAFLRSFLNLLRNVEETKTERTLRQFLQRLGIKRKNIMRVNKLLRL